MKKLKKLIKRKWRAFRLFCGYCPCGGKLETWAFGMYKCDTCNKTYRA